MIKFKDKYRKIKDLFNPKRPRGIVRRFDIENGEKVLKEETSNLVVYSGRNWLMQRATNTNISSPSQPYSKDSFISWFGVGSGGASGLIPYAPVLTDIEVNSGLLYINTEPTTDCAYDGKLHPFDSIGFEEDTSNSNQILISRFTFTLGKNDANGPNGTTYYDINELGLYVSDSSDKLTITNDSIKLFARVTFSTFRKFPNRQTTFEWDVYF